jgi:pimeloyl-ACP methyl ester carboxylesterase
MPQPLIEIGGDVHAPVLHFMPANGFVLETYTPLLRPFFGSHRVVSCPPRALWGDQTPPPLANAPMWEHLADDLLAGLEQYELQDVIAVGHSFGGVASAIATLQQPQRFKALILLDPTFLPEMLVDMLAQAFRNGMSDQHPLAQAAQRRKKQFDSVDELYARYRQKPLFADWDEEAFRAYAEYGTRPNPDGEGRILTWSAEWEAFYFSTGYADTWRMIPRLNTPLPTLIIRGGSSDTYLSDDMERVKGMLPNATHEVIANHGHLFPQSAPHATASVVQAWLKTQGLAG